MLGTGQSRTIWIIFLKYRTVKTGPKANRWEKWRQIQLISSPPDTLMCYCYNYSAMSWKNLYSISPTPPWPFLWAWKPNCVDWLLCLEELLVFRCWEDHEISVLPDDQEFTSLCSSFDLYLNRKQPPNAESLNCHFQGASKVLMLSFQL